MVAAARPPGRSAAVLGICNEAAWRSPRLGSPGSCAAACGPMRLLAALEPPALARPPKYGGCCAGNDRAKAAWPFGTCVGATSAVKCWMPSCVCPSAGSLQTIRRLTVVLWTVRSQVQPVMLTNSCRQTLATCMHHTHCKDACVHARLTGFCAIQQQCE